MQAHHDQKATISLLGFLASMTVVIASLGLLGLVVYTVETRRKEISIRKIIGAQVHRNSHNPRGELCLLAEPV